MKKINLILTKDVFPSDGKIKEAFQNVSKG